ncbi:response regulator transcription factor [uncultured Pseudoteredinibacter sp.]|uniref:response regulator transcription factor n=1 Tax=uncultured Pseudoteredinibacter sp. TaxID=1641701 RepID=UPI0026122647|nr:response regulator transcription factor [uncultured Pseudoteredinibacter sp.]
MQILIVEDDQELQAQLSRQLSNNGFQVQLANDGAQGLYFATEFPIDLAIIDLGLPRIDGMSLIERLREEELSFPILILTARSSWKTKVQGLDAGADDYLTKPFEPEELTARVNALLRRSTGANRKRLSNGPYQLDITGNAFFMEQEELELTSFEYRLMEHFMLNPGKIASKPLLLERLYDDPVDENNSNVLEVIIARLRKKLDPDGSIKPIETLRGRGYRFKQLAD